MAKTKQKSIEYQHENYKEKQTQIKKEIGTTRRQKCEPENTLEEKIQNMKGSKYQYRSLSAYTRSKVEENT